MFHKAWNLKQFAPLFLVILFFILVVFFINSKVSQADPISYTPLYRNLSLGSRGQDVQNLQRVLNTNPATQLALIGPGSPGQETTYFGQLTRKAVINFQQIHRAPSLSGQVDDPTLDLLNKYIQTLGGDATIDLNIQTGNGDASSTEQDQLNENFRASITVIPGFPYIDSISPKVVANGYEITIYGRYFSINSPNIVRMTYNDILATSTDGGIIKVKVNSDLQKMFEKQTQGMSSDQKDAVKEKIGKIPMFITIQNDKGISNPYLIYFRIK